jgi:hypothetical protein
MGLFDIVGGVINPILGEDTVARIPGLNMIAGAKTDASKALLKKQEELAREAKLQQERNTAARMQALGQSMLAFNPRNQMMAQMFGPQAAFSPQQFAQMGANPFGPPQLDPSLLNPDGSVTTDVKTPFGTTRTDTRKQAAVDEWARKKREYEAQQQLLQQGMAPVGPGPAALGPRAAPAGARRF